ncbi:helix-turn-helix domain-containing protein [Streptomyces longwoodensis]|uniref:helix-turn-helix domain-containing protein n=1 Tax=Streptomyces longwoodensis TaxID=68231 RepID=UPI003CCBC4DD
MSGLWSGRPVSVRLDDLEVICTVLGCQPCDLLHREQAPACAAPPAHNRQTAPQVAPQAEPAATSAAAAVPVEGVACSRTGCGAVHSAPASVSGPARPACPEQDRPAGPEPDCGCSSPSRPHDACPPPSSGAQDAVAARTRPLAPRGSAGVPSPRWRVQRPEPPA